MKTILIVEDNADVREYLRLYVISIGFKAVTAANGPEALDRALADPPDAILMDIMMPGMDGRETTRVLRTMPKTKDIPIIAVTALMRESDLLSCLHAGCNDYIVKPFKPAALESKLREYIHRR